MSDAFKQRQNLILPPHLQSTKVDVTRVSPELAAQCIVIGRRVADYCATEHRQQFDAYGAAIDLAVVHTHGRPMEITQMIDGDIELVTLDLIDIVTKIVRYDGQLPDFCTLFYQAANPRKH